MTGTEMIYPQERDQGFEKFFREYHRALERYVASRIGVTEDVHDIAALAMLQTFVYCRAHPDSIPYCRAVLFKIARNRIADHFAHRAKATVVSIEEAPQLPAHGSVITDLDARQDLNTALDALRDIRDSYREVIILHANVGLTITEIAEMMEKPPAHVRVILFRARRALKRALRKRGAL